MTEPSTKVAAAQHPRQTWAPNHPPARRSLKEALTLVAEYHGPVLDYVRVRVVADRFLKPDTFAQYAAYGVTDARDYAWDDFFVSTADGEEDDAVMVKVRESVFESDEAILAVLSHELFEIEKLCAEFQAEPRMTGTKIDKLIGPDRGVNFHSQAWDHADDMIRKMRERRAREGGKGEVATDDR